MQIQEHNHHVVVVKTYQQLLLLKVMDGFPIHEVFPGQMLLISHSVRHFSTWTLLFKVILVTPLSSLTVNGIIEGPEFKSLAHVKYQIQVGNPGT